MLPVANILPTSLRPVLRPVPAPAPQAPAHPKPAARSTTDIANLPGWLTTVTTRLCLDRLRQRLPMPDADLETELADTVGAPDPADDVALADTVGVALQVVLDRLTPRERVADYTQAIMDLGATCCVRSRPTCEVCPVAADCLARERGEQLAYPTPKPRKPLLKRSTTFLLLQRAEDGALWLEQRPAAGIWGGMWGFPEITDAADAAIACEIGRAHV